MQVQPGIALSDLRDMLEEQREFRIDQLRALHALGAGAPPAGGDPDVFRSLQSGARAALRDVHAALWRMDEGAYGRCTRCGGAVEIERLEILPQTAMCLPCSRP
jgi:RNA polymerase-binding transcription factor